MGGWNDKELGRQYEKASADHAQEMAKRIAAELRLAELQSDIRNWLEIYARSSDGLTVAVPVYQIERLTKPD